MRQSVVGIHKISRKIIPIAQVQNTGLKCECVCHVCGSPLEAVLNTSRIKHFRHSNKSNCEPTPETELHLLAKSILLNNNRLELPGCGITQYSEPVCEVRSGELIPDVTIIIEGKPLFVEIVVTNGLNAPKVQKYSVENAKVLIIDLRAQSRSVNYDELTEQVLNNSFNRYMLQYPSKGVHSAFSSVGILLGAAVMGFAALFIRNRFKTDQRHYNYFKTQRRI